MNEFSDDRFNIKIENGILFIEWLKENYNYDDIDFGVKKRLEIANGKAYPIFSDFNKAKFGTREARQRMSDKDAGEGVKAVAILVKSKVQSILYNFFNSIYKAPAAARLFTDREEALKWLEQFK